MLLALGRPSVTRMLERSREENGNLKAIRPAKSEPYLKIGSGGWIRTNDLRVMSPTSYQTAPPRIKPCISELLLSPATARAHKPKVETPFGSCGIGSPTSYQTAPPRIKPCISELLLSPATARAHKPKVETPFGSCGIGSPTSYQTAPPRIKTGCFPGCPVQRARILRIRCGAVNRYLQKGRTGTAPPQTPLPLTKAPDRTPLTGWPPAPA